MKRSLKKQVFYPDTAAILSPTRSKDRGAAPLKEGERSERNERVFWWAVDVTLGGGVLVGVGGTPKPFTLIILAADGRVLGC